MRVLSKPIINEFTEKHSKSKELMNVWYHQMKLGSWTNLNELKEDMTDVDYITNDRYVFNVGSYRIIAMIFFRVKQVYIRGIFTHKEYDKRRSQLPTL